MMNNITFKKAFEIKNVEIIEDKIEPKASQKESQIAKVFSSVDRYE